MSRTVDEFMDRCSRFARLYPDAVLAMPEPELAVDPKAAAHHLRSTRERARSLMVTTAKLARKKQNFPTPDLFGTACGTRIDA